MSKKNRVISLIILLMFCIMLSACSGKKDKESETVSEKKEKKKTEISFPYAIDEDRLMVNSLFQSSIENPDCENEYADDIASLEIENQSGKFLESAKITLHMSDDLELNMVIKDIPANQKVWVFDNMNQSIKGDAICESIDCEASFLDEDPLIGEQIKIKVKDTKVTLSNQSEETLSGLTVGCHCLFDGVYYGGLTYSYPVDEISPDGKTVIEADDCFLGTAEVVRISK